MSVGSSKDPFAGEAHDVLVARAESLAQLTEDETSGGGFALLLFELGEEWYAIGIECVREIMQEFEIAPIPCLPDYVPGVINIRGEIVSVTDVARQMRLAPTTENVGERPVIVVTNGDSTTALLVEAIGDIVDIAREAVEPPLSTIGREQAEYIAGSVYIDGTLVGVLNLDRVLEPVGAL